MKKMIKDWGIALAVVFIAMAGLNWFQGGGPTAGEAAPGFWLNDLQGQSVDLDGFMGKTVVVNFWASWCGPCKAEVPEFSRFAQAHPEVPVLGLAVDSGSEADVARAARQFGIDYPVALADSSLVNEWSVSGVPTTVVVGPDGTVRSSHVGAMNQEQLEAAVR